MVQPKTPPLSFRLAPDLVARVEVWAKKRKITRNAAVSQLLDAGLISAGPSLPPPRAQAAIKAEAMGRRNREPIHVDAPQLGTFERKPYQKGAKR